MKKISISFILCLLLFSAVPAFSAPLKVFVSISPQKWLCDSLGGPLVKTRVLIDKNQEPHTFEPSPRQLQHLFSSDLYFTIGLVFEQNILRRIPSQSNQLTIVDSSQKVERIPFQAIHDEHHHDAHTGEERDPHIWLAPMNLILIAENMAQALSQHDPENQATYARNLENLKQRLLFLQQKLARELKPYSGRIFYVFHPSFGYFADAYNLRQKAIETDGKKPTPKQMLDMITHARSDRVNTIFVQPEFDRKSTETIARAIGGTIVTLDPLAENVEANLDTIGSALIHAFNTN